MALPRRAVADGFEAGEHAAVKHDDPAGDEEIGGGPREPGDGEQIAQKAEDDATHPDIQAWRPNTRSSAPSASAMVAATSNTRN